MVEHTATRAGERLVTLDVIRGIAVMGIFSVNIVGMAMIDAAYMNPQAPRGYDLADVLIWLANYILIDGKMRSLFSMLFGASMLLVIERAEAAGERGWSIHFRRMARARPARPLPFLRDLVRRHPVHLRGDRDGRLPVPQLAGQEPAAGRRGPVRVAHGNERHSAERLRQADIAAHAPGATDKQKQAWAEATNGWATESDQYAREQAEHYHAPFVARVADIDTWGPYHALRRMLPETLALMLIGMAAYRSGFFTGTWDDARYRRVAAWGIGIGGAACALFGILEWASGFYAPLLLLLFMALGPPFQLAMALGYAALIILWARRPNWLRDRVAAAGRAAFTNYFCSSIAGALIFFGGGLALYGRLDRFHVWLIVPVVWLVDARLVEAVARPLRLWTVRMAVAQPRAGQTAADAQAASAHLTRGRSLKPAEILVAGLAPERALRRAGDQRIGGFFEQVDGLLEQPAAIRPRP